MSRLLYLAELLRPGPPSAYPVEGPLHSGTARPEQGRSANAVVVHRAEVRASQPAAETVVTRAGLPRAAVCAGAAEKVAGVLVAEGAGGVDEHRKHFLSSRTTSTDAA